MAPRCRANDCGSVPVTRVLTAQGLMDWHAAEGVTRQPVWELECDRGHRFNLTLERKSDLSVEWEGLYIGRAVFRDRTLILCPVQGCQAMCNLTGNRAEIEVKYTPPGRNTA